MKENTNTDNWQWGTIDSNGDVNSGTSFTPKDTFLTLDIKFIFIFLLLLFLIVSFVILILNKIKK